MPAPTVRIHMNRSLHSGIVWPRNYTNQGSNIDKSEPGVALGLFNKFPELRLALGSPFLRFDLFLSFIPSDHMTASCHIARARYSTSASLIPSAWVTSGIGAPPPPAGTRRRSGFENPALPYAVLLPLEDCQTSTRFLFRWSSFLVGHYLREPRHNTGIISYMPGIIMPWH